MIVIGLFAAGVFSTDSGPTDAIATDDPPTDDPTTPPSDSILYKDKDNDITMNIPMETDNFSFEPFELSGTASGSGEWCKNASGNNLGGTNLMWVNAKWQGVKDCDKWVTQTHPSAKHFSYDIKNVGTESILIS